MGILVRQPSGWRALDPDTYAKEKALQVRLLEFPDIMPRSPGARATTYCAEFRVGGDRIDLVGLGSDGSVSLVECKLDDNSGPRRTVIGQIFEYATRVRHMTVDQFAHAFAMAGHHDPFDLLRRVAGPKWSETACRENLAQTLALGSFRLIIAVDRVSAELQATIEYFNSQSGRRLIALQLAHFTSADTEILVPQVFGEEIAEFQDRHSRTALTYNWDYYRAVLPDAQFSVAQKVYGLLLEGIAARGLAWSPAPQRYYLSFKRVRSRAEVGIGLRRGKPIELWVKQPRELPTPAIYPSLRSHYDSHNRQWVWEVPAPDVVPDVGPLIDLATRPDVPATAADSPGSTETPAP